MIDEKHILVIRCSGSLQIVQNNIHVLLVAGNYEMTHYLILLHTHHNCTTYTQHLCLLLLTKLACIIEMSFFVSHPFNWNSNMIRESHESTNE